MVVDPPLLFRMLTTAVLRLNREGLGLEGNSIGSSSTTGAEVDVVVEVVVGDVVLDRAGLVPVALSAAFGLLGRGAGVVTGSIISSSNTASSTYSSSKNGADVVVVDVVDILGRRKRLLGGGGGVVVVVVVAITSSPNGISPST